MLVAEISPFVNERYKSLNAFLWQRSLGIVPNPYEEKECGRCEMILVLCDSLLEAMDSFDMFVGYLEENEPWSIKEVWVNEFCVETDENLRYIFINRRFQSFYEYLRPDVIERRELQYWM